MDRPIIPGSQDKTKEYVQPQYVVDSINNMFLLPTRPYLPGIVSPNISRRNLNMFQPAPAHLSPFVDNEAEGYIPDRQREINTLAGIETAVIAQHEAESERDKSEQNYKYSNK